MGKKDLLVASVLREDHVRARSLRGWQLGQVRSVSHCEGEESKRHSPRRAYKFACRARLRQSTLVAGPPRLLPNETTHSFNCPACAGVRRYSDTTYIVRTFYFNISDGPSSAAYARHHLLYPAPRSAKAERECSQTLARQAVTYKAFYPVVLSMRLPSLRSPLSTRASSSL